MPDQVMPKVREAADTVRGWVVQHEKASQPIRVTGQLNTGKSTLLRTLASDFQKSKEYTPILISPSPRSLDAGPVAIMQVVADLKAANLVNGEVDSLFFQGQATWADQLSGLREVLTPLSSKLVLLVDNPDVWAYLPSEHPHFGSRARDVVRLLEDQLDCPRVVTHQVAGNAAAGRHLRLPGGSDSERFLRERDRWGALAEWAERLADTAGKTLDTYTPLNLRLLVALTAVSAEAVNRERLPKVYHVASDLWYAIRKSKDFLPLAEVWERIALVRGAFEECLLAKVGVDQLNPLGKEILVRCLLHREENDALALDDSLRTQPQKRDALSTKLSEMNLPQRLQWHRVFAEYYREQVSTWSDRAKSSPSAMRPWLTSEMEAFFHAAECQDLGLIKALRIFFSEQLNILGRSLSLGAKRYSDAVSVFERSVQWNAEDDYAHHYLAFNLDVQGVEPSRVEKHYVRAIELYPTHEWWWSRWICFLITMSRPNDAEAAWDQALEILRLPDSSARPDLYLNLHSWVARVALQRNQLRLAEKVLEAVPAEVFTDEDNQVLTTLRRRLRILTETEKGGAVFPASIDPEEWWSKGPFLSSRKHPSGKDLSAWMPARIETVDRECETVNLLGATPPKDGQPPRYGRLTISIEKFDAWSLDDHAERLAAGRFVEIAYYGEGNGTAVAIRVHPERRLSDLFKRSPLLDSGRYVRSQVQTFRWRQ